MQWIDVLMDSASCLKNINLDTRSDSEILLFNSTKYNNQDDQLQSIEDEMSIVMLLKKRKRLSPSDEPKLSKKRGRYTKETTMYFTNPDTGERSVITYHYTLWYQNYVLNPQPSLKLWDCKFRRRFRLPYQ